MKRPWLFLADAVRALYPSEYGAIPTRNFRRLLREALPWGLREAEAANDKTS